MVCLISKLMFELDTKIFVDFILKVLRIVEENIAEQNNPDLMFPQFALNLH